MKTLLLIEDDGAIRDNTAEILELAGYNVQTAENGKVGIEKALANLPDLVICDIRMPVLDGYGVLHVFNKNPSLSGIPFIFLTAKTDRAEVRKGMELGADDYVTKPFGESELLSAIEGRLNRFQSAAPTHIGSTADPWHAGAFLNTDAKNSNLQSLLADRKVHTLLRKQVVYWQGDEAIRLYFLKSGKVKTMRVNADGKEFITDFYQSGDFFGYLPLLEDTEYTDTVVTLTDVELIYIPKEEFKRLLLGHPEVSQQFIKLLASHVNEREEQLLNMAYNSINRRVADTLLRLFKQEPEGIIQLSRHNLAAMIGTAPETLIRTLKKFKEDGLLDMGHSGSIRIVQPQKLQSGNW
ncbi:response regulator [Larkinella sp. C7]|jgi:CRP-like cAMP-binding protein/CheY-like chemotaxis protein|uniref:response regulator n=1 Tax=Larkinella sp. C7 TaxID=2576607 RepID=UPI0011112AA0|nr:response regulator [Larkinella sp. C7]